MVSSSQSQIPNQRLINWSTHQESYDVTSPVDNTRIGAQSASKRLRTACDLCRQSRVKCSGGNTCQRCESNSFNCKYGISMRQGRVKASGTKQITRSDSASSSGTSKRRRGNNSPEPEEIFQGESFNATTECPLSKGATNEVFPDMVFGNDDILMSNGFPDFAFTYPTPNSDPFSGLSEIGIVPAKIGPGINMQQQFQPNLNFSLDAASQLDVASGTARSISDPPPSFDAGAIFSLGSKPKCQCLSTQLFCVAEMCNMEDPISIPLDVILQTVRQKCKGVSAYLSCTECFKTSANFIFPAIICQRVGLLLCNVSRNGCRYVQQTKLRVGAFELSDEEDALHKKMLVCSAEKQFDCVLSLLRDTAAEYEQKMGNTTTESGKSNLKWVFDAVRNMKARVQIVFGLLEAPGWGCQPGKDDYICRPT